MLGLASKTILFPYWLILVIRNYLYDKQILKSEKFDVPVVSLGNITAGGTGKTPHAEMMIEALKGRYRLAVVSRGYRREGKGFHIVGVTDDYRICGDESLQIKRKFPDVIVAVCADRNFAIRRLVDECGADFILLDDAYQYRRLIPSRNILLVSYRRSIAGDNLLPIGRLRDLPLQKERADAVIITKSPDLTDFEGCADADACAAELEAERRRWREELSLRQECRLYFSTMVCRPAKPVFPEICDVRYLYSKFAVAFTGIADDSLFRAQLAATHKVVGALSFADHKDFGKRAMGRIVSMARRQPEAAIVTTEKDSQRLICNKYLPDDLKRRMFYIPVGCRLVPETDMEEFISFVSPNRPEE